ncbi:hypothetical protein IY230_01815 [Acholeplasma laidlawii]|nr:hypothetical protein [Acholeplasma laidlawii]MBG0762347.1 hypothetical protein [Acholeplasma laidlawii]
MKKETLKKKTYDSPTIEITEFSMKDSIATSGAGLNEQVWGGGGDV